MKIVDLKAANFRAFESLHLDEPFFSESKYLFVGKNGSGKTTALEAIRLPLSLSNDQQNITNQQYFAFLRDPSKSATLELTIELDDEEVQICKEYLDTLTNEGSPPWNQDERLKYATASVDNKFISRISLDPVSPMGGSGTARTATLNQWQTYISFDTDSKIDENGAPARLFHIIRKLLMEKRDRHKPLIYINPFRSVQISEPQVFQNFGMIQQALNPSQGQVINDPVAGANVSAPEYAKAYYQFNYNHELYGGVISELYHLATSTSTGKKLEKLISKEMNDINQMLRPKRIASINIDKDSNLVYYEISDGETKYPITSMSAGEEQLVIFGLTLPKYLNATKDSIKPLVIIDEPEVHLHPEFAKRLGAFLNDKLQVSGSQQLFVASHSVEIVQAMAENAYQISSGGIKKIDDVIGRADIFNDMGSSFSVADLVSKVVFVEGSERATKSLKDSDFYQKLIDDPYSKLARFISIGGKSSVLRVKAGGDEWKDFVSTQVGKLGDGNLYAVLDGDVLNWTKGLDRNTDMVYYLPCNSMENLLLQPEVIMKAYGDKIQRTALDQQLTSIKDELIVATRDKILLGEYDRSKGGLFGMGGSDDKAVVTNRFNRSLTPFLAERQQVLVDYQSKVSALDDWYLHVDGKMLQAKIVSFLHTNKQSLNSNLLKQVELSDMPQEMQTWFNDHIK